MISSPHDRQTLISLVCAASLVLGADPSGAQRSRRPKEPAELHGSVESVERMYDFAQSHGLAFYRTPADVTDAIAKGRLVELPGDSAYEVKSDVKFSYATREARQFVADFAPQYLAACGAPLTVTSAERPVTKQPRNANPHSVHPTGIAVDFRRPPAGPCLYWVRNALANLERDGIIEATEEHHPVHLHVAVLVPPGKSVILPPLARPMAVSHAASTSAMAGR